MNDGQVERIHVAGDSGDQMTSRESVEAVAGRGLRGDRYFDEQGLWNALDEEPARADEPDGASDVTFIEAEAIEAVARDADIEVPAGAHRRNVTTRNVPLNHLVGVRFSAGDAVCEGVQLCEPCGYMQSMVGEDGLANALTHRGGLDARVVESGSFGVGDRIEW